MPPSNPTESKAYSLMFTPHQWDYLGSSSPPTVLNRALYTKRCHIQTRVLIDDCSQLSRLAFGSTSYASANDIRRRGEEESLILVYTTARAEDARNETKTHMSDSIPTSDPCNHLPRLRVKPDLAVSTQPLSESPPYVDLVLAETDNTPSPDSTSAEWKT